MQLAHRKHKGSIIAFTIILLSILLTTGLSVVTVASLEKKSGLSTQKSVVAFQAADSGIERVLERIYITNSPPFSSVPENGAMPDPTLQQVAAGLQAVTNGAACSNASSKIVATSNSSPAYTFEVSFFDGSDAQISCADAEWRDKVVRIKTEGFFHQTSRVIELGIKPRPKCDAGDTVQDADGNNYGVVIIGDQCWLDRNMMVGTEVPSSTPQIDNPGGNIIEYYCYDDDSNNCTSNHPNQPDGGLYTWDEAMEYDTNEGAQGICPNGWHIPTDADWYYMENFVDTTINNPNAVGWRGTDAGTKLKPGGTSGLELNIAGYRNSGSFSARGDQAHYMSSTLSSPSVTWERAVDQTEARFYRGTITSGSAIQKSVRCVAD